MQSAAKKTDGQNPTITPKKIPENITFDRDDKNNTHNILGRSMQNICRKMISEGTDPETKIKFTRSGVTVWPLRTLRSWVTPADTWEYPNPNQRHL